VVEIQNGGRKVRRKVQVTAGRRVQIGPR
jgi:hypothetical protein